MFIGLSRCFRLSVRILPPHNPMDADQSFKARRDVWPIGSQHLPSKKYKFRISH